MSLYFYLTDTNIPYYIENQENDKELANNNTNGDIMENVLIFFEGILTLYPNLSIYFWLDETNPMSKSLRVFFDSILMKKNPPEDLFYHSVKFIKCLSKEKPFEIHNQLIKIDSFYNYNHLFGYLYSLYDQVKHINQKISNNNNIILNDIIIGEILDLISVLSDENIEICEYYYYKNEYHLFEILLTFIYYDVNPIIKVYILLLLFE